MQTFKEIIRLWPSCEALGADVGASGNTVRKWLFRDSVPGTHWASLVKSASERGITGVTVDLLAKIADRSRKDAA